MFLARERGWTVGIFDQIRNMQKTEVTKVTEVTAAESLENNGNIPLDRKVTKVTEDAGSEESSCCKNCGAAGICAESDNGVRLLGSPNWEGLLGSNLDDFGVICVEAAIFLFAVRSVQTCAQYDFEAMCRRYVPGWRKNMAPEAWKVVAGEIRKRLPKQ